MPSNISPVFDVLTQRMDYLKQRQAVIGQNVANADSPGYRARDLVTFDKVLKGEGQKPITIAATNPNHLKPDGSRVGGAYADDKKAGSYEVLPSGNSVIIEEQMIKVAQIGSDYQLATNLYKRMNNMVKIAIGKGG